MDRITKFFENDKHEVVVNFSYDSLLNMRLFLKLKLFETPFHSSSVSQVINKLKE